MSLHSLEDTFKQTIKDLYNAEQQLVEALPALSQGAECPELKAAFREHLEATKGHVTRLEDVFKLLGMPARGKKCAAMEGLISEGKEILAERDGSGPAVDAALIVGAQKVEHYEISGYGSARSIAELLDLDEVAQLLQDTLDEESEANEKLTEIASNKVNRAALPKAEANQEAPTAHSRIRKHQAGSNI